MSDGITVAKPCPLNTEPGNVNTHAVTVIVPCKLDDDEIPPVAHLAFERQGVDRRFAAAAVTAEALPARLPGTPLAHAKEFS